MARRFVPLPYDAIRCGRKPLERAFIQWLYQEAHRSWWEPFRLHETWAADHDLSRRALRRILDDLEEMGLVERIMKTTGRRKEGSFLRVFDPTLEEDAIGESEKEADNNADNNADNGRTTTRTTGTKEEAEQASLTEQRLGQRADNDLDNDLDNPLDPNPNPEPEPRTRDLSLRARESPPPESQPAPPTPSPDVPRAAPPPSAVGAAGGLWRWSTGSPPASASATGPLPPGSLGSLDADYRAACQMWATDVLGEHTRQHPRSRSKTGVRLVELLSDLEVGWEMVQKAIFFAAKSRHRIAQHIRAKRFTLLTALERVDEYADLWDRYGDGPIPDSEEDSRRNKKTRRPYATPESEAFWRARGEEVRERLRMGTPPAQECPSAPATALATTGPGGRYARLLAAPKGEP